MLLSSLLITPSYTININQQSFIVVCGFEHCTISTVFPHIKVTLPVQSAIFQFFFLRKIPLSSFVRTYWLLRFLNVRKCLHYKTFFRSLFFLLINFLYLFKCIFPSYLSAYFLIGPYPLLVAPVSFSVLFYQRNFFLVFPYMLCWQFL
jgi:hypothetical protein